MHEGAHDILEEEHHHHHGTPKVSSSKDQESFFSKYKKLSFPLLLAVMIFVTWLLWRQGITARNWAVIPHIIGGTVIVWNTTLVTLAKRRITAGILVFMALIGTAYIHEYVAGAIVAFMMIFGEFLEEITLERTRNAVRELVNLAPDTARKNVNGEFKMVPVSEVQVDDIVLVQPGERIPVDGKIIKGQAAINESSITGESMPVDKETDDDVFVGTINENGVLEIQTEKVGQDTTLGKIIQVVRGAQENKGETQRTADHFAQYFVPVVLAICAVVWFLTTDLIRVMAVLVVACPCALVLATPTAVVASVGNAARRGGLIRGGISLEKAGVVDIICLDKTGTVTEGKPRVVNLTSFKGQKKEEVLKKALIAERDSQHPIAQAILDHGQKEGFGSIPAAGDFEMLFGRGVRVKYSGEVIEVSNSRVLQEKDLDYSSEVKDFLKKEERKGRTALVVLVNNTVIGGLSIADTIRPEVKGVVERFQVYGIKNILMLTGDNQATAKAIAQQAGITDYRANLLPEEKLAVIKELQEKGHTVAMVGDGVNDAPALTLADVGIAMGVIGTDVAVESSDIALMSDSLKLVPDLLILSKRTLRIIKQNIWVFAVLVNFLGVLASGLGHLSPIGAAIVHNMASVFVVVNSARLLRFGSKKNTSSRMVPAENYS